MTRLFMTADAVGGVWSYALDLARGLAPLGYDTTLALLGPAPSEAQRADAAAAGVRLLDTGLPLDWLAEDEAAVRASARALARIAREDGAELIQLNQPAFAAEPMPVPVVSVVHSCVATWWLAAGKGAMPESFGWQTALVRAGLAQASTAVCPSAAFARAVQGAYHLPVAPAVVHNGRAPLPSTERAQSDVVFTAGRLWDAGKDAATLDRAAALLDAPVRAAGSVTSPDGQRVRLDRLDLLGSLDADALGAELAARPVFASAALYEPFGLAVLEAAQAGCALVLSDIPTFRELWDGAATFVPPRHAADFAEACRALLADPAARAARGAAARERAERYTVAAMAAGMAGIYAGVDARAAA